MKGSSIIIDGVKFGHKDILNLPKGLSIDKVKIVSTKDGIAFQSHHAYMSNMYPCRIVLDGIDYKSSEHLYHAEMARYHNRQDLVAAIIRAKDGYVAKRLARDIDLADNWETAKLDVMGRVIKLKFDQNHDIREKLLKTTGFLYEATKGDSFACGMLLAQAKDISQETISGANHLGIIIAEYRDSHTHHF